VATRDESGEQRQRGGGRRSAVAIGAGLGISAAAGVWLLPAWERPWPEPGSVPAVTVSGAASAVPVQESVPSLTIPQDTAPPRRTLSRRESIGSNAPPPARERPPATPEAGVAEVRRTPTPQEEPESAPSTPERIGAGAEAAPSEGASDPAPESSAPTDSGLGYAPNLATEPPPPTPPLDRTEAMRLALGDVTRLRIVDSYKEAAPGVLVLGLGRGYGTSPSLEYNLGRLYAAYGELLQYPDTDPVMELWLNGRKLGEYTRDGLRLGSAK
jgi:hypothetical protein